MTLGEKIRFRRTELGMTMEDLGNAIGVQRSAINKYEKGTISDLKLSTIESLSKALDVSVFYLLNDDPADANTVESQIISECVDRMPEEKRQQALNIFRAAYSEYFPHEEEKHA